MKNYIKKKKKKTNNVVMLQKKMRPEGRGGSEGKGRGEEVLIGEGIGIVSGE